MKGRRMSHISTAGDTRGDVLDFLRRDMPQGLVLNLGAGRTGISDGSHLFVNIDLSVPRAVPPGCFVVADVQQLPFRPETFEAFLIKDVIEHHSGPAAVLSEARRVAKQGAVAVITTPRAVPRAVWADPTHVRGFTADALLQLINLTGWAALHRPKRWGSIPGAGRLRLVNHLEAILRVPGPGHYFGTNWILRVVAR